jgi:hypothetical protein
MAKFCPMTEKIRLFVADNMTRFPTDADCLAELTKYIDVRCTHCGCAELERTEGRRDARCLGCNKITWLTAGTFFAYMKEPRIWLIVIELLSSGIIFSGAALSRGAETSLDTALRAIKKVSSVCLPFLEKIGARVQSKSFASGVFRRSTESPAKQHPHAEFDEIDRELAARQNTEQALLNSLSEPEKAVYACCSNSKSVSLSEIESKSGLATSQVLPALTLLEIAGHIETTEIGEYVRVRQTLKPAKATKQSKKIDQYIDRSLDLIAGPHGGVSRKFLQLYLAKNFLILDRKRWTRVALLKACSSFGAITSNDLSNYASPPVVLMCRLL